MNETHCGIGEDPMDYVATRVVGKPQCKNKRKIVYNTCESEHLWPGSSTECMHTRMEKCITVYINCGMTC